MVIPPAGFLAGLRELCDRNGALLVFDEIQCGFGRSGAHVGGEHEGVVPDLMTVGKGIGGGLALAAVLGREDVMTTWAPDAITSTFLANALNAAAACAAIDVLRDEGLVERSRAARRARARRASRPGSRSPASATCAAAGSSSASSSRTARPTPTARRARRAPSATAA